MIDNLTEAIKEYKDFAECETETARVLRNIGNEKDAKYYEETAENDKKIVAWLTELQERREVEKWISVKERLPDTNDNVLVYDGSDMFVAWYENEGMSEGWHSFDDSYDGFTPIIVWRPLPKAPESEDNK